MLDVTWMAWGVVQEPQDTCMVAKMSGYKEAIRLDPLHRSV